MSAPTLEAIADLFTELANDELAELIGGDLADVSPRELAEQFREACSVLDGLKVMAEAMIMGNLHRARGGQQAR